MVERMRNISDKSPTGSFLYFLPGFMHITLA